MSIQRSFDNNARSHDRPGERTYSADPNAQAIHSTAKQIEIQCLLKGGYPRDFSHVFETIDKLRRLDPKGFHQDLKAVNDELHKQGILPGLEIIEDDRPEDLKHHAHGYSVVAEDKQNPPHNHTIVSTTHGAPHEPKGLRDVYGRMLDGTYNGWNQSVEGGGGAHGGFDRHAVGGHVSVGARKELIDKALELAGIPVTPENEKAVNTIVTRESSWNPNITNNWDINAKRGHPSTGLMQTIPSTFQQYALHGFDKNIHDPLSNLIAGIRYAEARYHGHGRSGVANVARRRGGY